MFFIRRGVRFVFIILIAGLWVLTPPGVFAKVESHDAGIIAPAPLFSGAPQLILTKSVEDNITSAQVGDVIRYRIRFECSSLTTACGEMEITDTLQSGLTYLPPPNSSVPSGFEINYNGGTSTIAITKTDNNLLDGTQYDAVIAVRVNQDFRPLPATINNTVEGRIDPPGPVGWTDATPASAPGISIGEVSPSWELTKTRIAPVIEPTLDTDVTYSLSLCPVIPPSGGIASLSNIVLADVLPPGAEFVSASDSGTLTYDSGTDSYTFTWDAIAGPVDPPDCVRRYITMTYPSSDFNIDDELTNTGLVSAEYVPSGGGACVAPCFSPDPTELDHDIIDILDVPTYGKDDAGDPVGITGTGRFILSLDTNGTNYPANNVTLIDNMPGALQVTSVTSGRWSEDFDYVRAHVEYSTDLGTTWVPFAGSPVEYGDDLTFSTLPDNITNLRWRFEYDADGDTVYTPGLPYVWSFSSAPQIRFIPRPAATTADDVGSTVLPAALEGQTYTNCVYVTRTNIDGDVIDACEEEDITISGDYVSLQVSKRETPGTPWDEWEDPNIDTFTSDTTILPGDTLRYVLTVDMTERSSAPLVDPFIQDVLPDDLIFIRFGDALLNGGPLPGGASVTTSQSGPNPGVGNTLTWDFSGLTVPEIELGSNLLTVEFFARIPRGQAPGTRTNDILVITDSDDVYCENGTQDVDGSDLDGDSESGEATCSNSDSYVVERSAALRGEKWIRAVDSSNSEIVGYQDFLPDFSCPSETFDGIPGNGSNPFTRFPCISQAYPEGALSPGQYAPPPANPLLDDFEYQLRIYNDGNVDMINYALYDILPYYGDKGSGGTLSSSDRESEFRPVLTGPVVFLGGGGLSSSDFTIEYSLSTNPCRPEVFNTTGTIPGGCSNSWVSSATAASYTSAEWAEVRAYRILLNSGSFIEPYEEGDDTNILRFGVPMSIPADSPLVGAFNNDDAQSLEIAWNSFSHVGSYTDLLSNIRDLLASEPRKVGITIPERFSLGNRVWRDSDNSGTINAPDDLTPGISNVLVHLYDASDTTTPIATTTTDADGYYLFSNLPAGSYVVGIPASNFDPGGPLEDLRSSTGAPSVASYTNPTDPNPDSSDHGIDPLVLGDEVFSPVIILSSEDELELEPDLSLNDRDGPAGTRRGVNGERDYNSDLTVDFGFFGGSDIPFSIGNHLWYDDDANGGILNDGIRQAGDNPVMGARVELYRDGNGNGSPDDDEFMRFDTTDANGFYLFDNLDPGTYFVVVAASNFQDGGVLAGWYSSQPTGSESLGVNGGTTTADIDNDDNGINAAFPEVTGVRSGAIVLVRNVDEPLGEAYLSGEADPGSPVNEGFNPTGWDGPNSRGRFGEPDANSNLTIDFGFIPPMSIGNRVWFDSGSGETIFRSQYNNGLQDGTEVGVSGVTVELWLDDDGTPGLQIATDSLLYTTTTDANGYYLFDRLQPGDGYYVRIPPSNFGSGQPLENYLSSTDAMQSTAPADDAEDMDDNGIDEAAPATNGVTSPRIEIAYGTEPTTPADETDIPAGTPDNITAYGADLRGRYGQEDANSNLTIDFGFVPVYALGNRVWFDTNNNSQIDGSEQGVDGVLVQLFDSLGNEIPVGPDGILGTADDTAGGMLTDNGGYYLFDRLEAGEYVVVIAASNFDAGGVLENYWSSATTRNDDGSLTESAASSPDAVDSDEDDNGTLQSGGSYPGAVISLTVTLGTGFNEPTGETDLDSNLGGSGQGQPDLQANMTVDFGFYTIQLGNQVWNDLDNSGLVDGSETGINGVVVQLWSADGTTLLATTTTATVGPDQGVYTFSGLPQGNYLVRLPEGNFLGVNPLRDFYSSTGGGSEPAPNPDSDFDDSDDNGSEMGVLGFTGGYIQSDVFALSPQAEQSFDHSQGLTTEFRVDFGVYNNAQADLEVTKTDNQDAYIPGGTLTYTIVVTNNGPADVNGVVVEDLIPGQVASWDWACTAQDGGATGCDTYSGSGNFTDTVNMPLDSSITYTVTVNVDSAATGTLTNTVTVSLPSGYTDPEPDNNEDEDADLETGLTVTKTDNLSIVAPGSTLTYTITIENTGAQDLTGIQLVDVIPAGTDFDSASDGGTENIGVVTWPQFDLLSGASTTRTVTVQVQDEQSLADAAISSLVNTVSVEDDGSTTDGDPVTDDDTDIDNIAVANVKQLTATSEPDSTINTVSGFERVFIGETLTYVIQITLPPGTVNDLVATDTLEEGLAFDECTATGVTVPAGVNVTLPTGLTSACPAPSGDSRVTDDGHIVQFTFGTVENTTGTDQTITVEYTAVVLDIASNRDGVSGINNAVVWTWDGGTLAGQADPVEIIEPDMDIVKDAEPTVASIGDTITFTLDIFHTAESTADAYDVEVIDILPAGLGFVPGSVVVTGLPPTTETYDSLTNTLVFTWDAFPLGQTSLLEFQAVLLDAPVLNSANVAWTSLPIDPGLDGLPVQQSEYNIYSTERWYDPADPAGVNSYGRSSSVGIEELILPDTGFAPGRQTVLPEQPAGLAYEVLQDARLEIPALGLNLPIVSVPVGRDGWDLTWLSTQAGYLQTTTLPGNVGNTALTGHVYLADGTPGPFVNLHTLYWGQKIIMHVDGYTYTYEVREKRFVQPWNTSVLEEDGYAWLTLITCKDFNEFTGEYATRVAVRAVLLDVSPSGVP